MEHPRGLARPASTTRLRVNSATSMIAWAGAGVFVFSLASSFIRTCGGSGACWRHQRHPSCRRERAALLAFAAHHSVFARTGIRRGFDVTFRRRSSDRSTRGRRACSSSRLPCMASCPGHVLSMGITVASGGVHDSVQRHRADISCVRPSFWTSRDPAGPSRPRLRARARAAVDTVFSGFAPPALFRVDAVVWGAADMTGTRAVFAVISCAYVAVAIAWGRNRTD